MAESLMTVASNYLATQILANMGSAGDYGTLQLTTVKQWARFDVPDFEGTATVPIVKPFAIVSAYRSNSESAGHGSDNTLARKINMPIALTIVCEGDKDTATANAQTLAWRLEEFLAGLRATGASIVNDGGDKLSRVIGGGDGRLFTVEVGLWDKPTSTGDVYGVAMAAVVMTGTVT